ncbi:RNA polymerase sigma factor [Patescibacteria group bacterium]|nr:RNA polymerase sigma factor [Patescibacteria group bacterium]
MNASIFKQKLLLVRAQNGDSEAFGEIYDLYVDKIYRFIFFKVSNHETAEDLCAEVFLKTWQYMNEPDKREVSNLNALLYQSARNIVIDYYRTSQREILADTESLKLVEDSRQQSFLEKVAISSEIENIEAHLRKLKDEFREVLILKFVDELSNKEISKILDKSNGATRVLIHRALKVLKDTIDESKNSQSKNGQ